MPAVSCSSCTANNARDARPASSSTLCGTPRRLSRLSEMFTTGLDRFTTDSCAHLSELTDVSANPGINTTLNCVRHAKKGSARRNGHLRDRGGHIRQDSAEFDIVRESPDISFYATENKREIGNWR